MTDSGHGRARDHEGVRHVKESLLGEISGVYFPYGKRERGVGGGAGAIEVKGGGRPGEAASLRTASGTPSSSSDQEPQLAVLLGTDRPEKLTANTSRKGTPLHPLLML